MNYISTKQFNRAAADPSETGASMGFTGQAFILSLREGLKASGVPSSVVLSSGICRGHSQTTADIYLSLRDSVICLLAFLFITVGDRQD